MKLTMRTLKDCNLCYDPISNDVYRFTRRGGGCVDVYDINDGYIMVEGCCDRTRYVFDIMKVKSPKGLKELKELIVTDFLKNHR